MRLSRPASARFVLAAASLLAVTLVLGVVSLGAGPAGAAPAGARHQSQATQRPAAKTRAPSCSGVSVVSLATTLVTGPAGMQLDLTLSRAVGMVLAYVGGTGGVAEAGALGPVAGSPGSYTGFFVPPSGVPVAEGAQVVVTACSGHLLAVTTVGSTTWTTGTGRSTGPSAPATTSTTVAPTASPTASAACSGAQITGLSAALTDGGGVQVTLQVSTNVGPAASAYVVSASVPGTAGIKAGSLPETSTPGTYQGIVTPPGGGATGEVVEVGICRRLRAHTTVGSASWAPGGVSTEPTTTTTTTTLPTTTTTVGTTESSSACTGAAITGVTSALTADRTGVTVTITVNHSLGGLGISTLVEVGTQVVAEGNTPEVPGQPGVFRATFTSTSGSPIPTDAEIRFGVCGGTANRIGGTSTVGSATWTPN